MQTYHFGMIRGGRESENADLFIIHTFPDPKGAPMGPIGSLLAPIGAHMANKNNKIVAFPPKDVSFW